MKAMKFIDNVVLLSHESHKTRTLIFKRSRTHKLVVRYKVIYYPNELPISAKDLYTTKSGARCSQCVLW